MFELFVDDTPNAHKVSIMLEEIQADYKVTLIDIGKGDQFKDDFKKIAKATSDMRSPAYGPIMPPPMTLSVSFSNRSFVNPSSRPIASDRPLAAHGNLDFS